MLLKNKIQVILSHLQDVFFENTQIVPVSSMIEVISSKDNSSPVKLDQGLFRKTIDSSPATSGITTETMSSHSYNEDDEMSDISDRDGFTSMKKS